MSMDGRLIGWRPERSDCDFLPSGKQHLGTVLDIAIACDTNPELISSMSSRRGRNPRRVQEAISRSLFREKFEMIAPDPLNLIEDAGQMDANSGNCRRLVMRLERVQYHDVVIEGGLRSKRQ